MKIELLIIDGCPNGRPTADRVRQVLRELGLNEPVIQTTVTDVEIAQELRFLGSPTVRIDGLDIEPSARHRTAFGMMCRTYEGSGGVPSDELIRSAMVESRNTE